MKLMRRENGIRRREIGLVKLKNEIRTIRVQQRSQQLIRIVRMRQLDVRDAVEESMSLLIAHGILVLILDVDRKDTRLQIAPRWMKIDPHKQRMEVKGRKLKEGSMHSHNRMLRPPMLW